MARQVRIQDRTRQPLGVRPGGRSGARGVDRALRGERRRTLLFRLFRHPAQSQQILRQCGRRRREPLLVYAPAFADGQPDGAYRRGLPFRPRIQVVDREAAETGEDEGGIRFRRKTTEIDTYDREPIDAATEDCPTDTARHGRHLLEGGRFVSARGDGHGHGRARLARFRLCEDLRQRLPLRPQHGGDGRTRQAELAAAPQSGTARPQPVEDRPRDSVLSGRLVGVYRQYRPAAPRGEVTRLRDARRLVRTTLLLFEEVPLGDQSDRRRERRVRGRSGGGDDRPAVGFQRLRATGAVDEFAFRRRSDAHAPRGTDVRDRIARYGRAAAASRRGGGVAGARTERAHGVPRSSGGPLSDLLYKKIPDLSVWNYQMVFSTFCTAFVCQISCGSID